MTRTAKDEQTALLEAVAVTAELTGTELSKAAAKIMAADLALYPLAQVLRALTRCRRELRGRLTIAAVLERLDDGRPGAEEAWALVPVRPDGHPDEMATTVWTDEIGEAYGVAVPLLHAGEVIAARMAFKEAYQKAIAAARDARRPVRWWPSLGHDPAAREGPLRVAEGKGRLTHARVAKLLPPPTAPNVVHLLTGPRSECPPEIRDKLRQYLTRRPALPTPIVGETGGPVPKSLRRQKGKDGD